MSIAAKPWRIKEELIEQPSWGGRYIVDLKGLAGDPAWTGKKIGQSYELARSSVLIDPATGQEHALSHLIASSAGDLLGPGVLSKFGSDLSLLIKLTQAKGNSFQVHLPVGKTLGYWLPKPEAWYFLAPGLFTFGIRRGVSFEDFSSALLGIDEFMKSLSGDVKAGKLDIARARALAAQEIARVNPYQYVNTVEAGAGQIVDLTDGGIHHSWEENDAKFPNGNLVYEVQVDVPDDRCSMRGFDKGKMLDDGGLRPTHVADYLATIERDERHNDLMLHIRTPRLRGAGPGYMIEALFETPYFLLDRIRIEPNGMMQQSAERGFHHLFVFVGAARIGDTQLLQGQSYLIPAAMGTYTLESANGSTIFKTHLPVE